MNVNKKGPQASKLIRRLVIKYSINHIEYGCSYHFRIWQAAFIAAKMPIYFQTKYVNKIQLTNDTVDQ